jgi:hypothetical protein
MKSIMLSRIVVHAFVILYIFVVGLWLVYPCPLRAVLLRPFAATVDYIGLWQGWGVFSPNIRKCNVTLDANVYYDDGSKIVWQYPRIDQMPLLDKLYKERYRKFGYDHLNWESDNYLWPRFAEYVAGLNAKPGKRVVAVEFNRHWRNILTPELELAGKHDQDHSYTFYRRTL